MNELNERLYKNARTLTKLMIIHEMDIIDRELDSEFEEYFDEFIEMAYITDYGDTVIQLFDGERILLEGLADDIHYGYLVC